MVQIIKSGTIKVPTQPKDFDLKATGLVFKSYDNQVALEFNVEKQDGTPADLLGANLRLLMFIYDEIDGTVTKEPIPFITKNLITESFLNGHVVYILPEAMKAYNGMVETYVYIEYSDGSTSDNLGFTFRMQRSKIDGLAQDKADYFITDFQQLLDAVKQKAADAADAVNETLAKVEASSTAKMQELEQRIDEQTEIFNDADVYNKAEIEDKLEPFALRTDIDTLEIKKADKIDLAQTNENIENLDSTKADKTALAQANASMAANLATKVDKGGNEQVTLRMLSQEVKTAMTGGSVAVVGPNSVNTTNVIDKSITQRKAANVLLGVPIFEFFTPPNIDTASKTLTFPAGRVRFGTTIKAISAQTLDLTSTTWGSVFYNSNTGLFSYETSAHTGVVEADAFLVGSMDIATLTKIRLYFPFSVSIDGDYQNSYQIFENSIVYHAGVLRTVTSGTNIMLKIDSTVNTLYVYTLRGNQTFFLDQTEYLIPHNHSLVANVLTSKLEIVDTTTIRRGTHVTLIVNHNGLVKYSNVRIESAESGTSYSKYFRSKETRFDFQIDQDACLVGDEIWFFGGGSRDFSAPGIVNKVNKDTYEVIGTIEHTLGHANGIDFLNDTLLVHNGNAINNMAEISLFKNPVGKSSLNVDDDNNTLIKFHDGGKVLETAITDGAACFGENERIMYLFGFNTCIYKVLLGMGDNDLSDKTEDNSDLDSWGTFTAGKSATEYNGTAKIIDRFYGTRLGQLQGVTFRNGELHVLTGFKDILDNVIEFSNGAYRIKEKIGYAYTDSKNQKIDMEPESILFNSDKLIIGCRSHSDSFIVETEV